MRLHGYDCNNSIHYNIYMLRISNLVRGRIPKRLPMRAGLPNWDRPDPPPSAIVPLDHEVYFYLTLVN